jgi:hypothetical protein
MCPNGIFLNSGNRNPETKKPEKLPPEWIEGLGKDTEKIILEVLINAYSEAHSYLDVLFDELTKVIFTDDCPYRLQTDKKKAKKLGKGTLNFCEWDLHLKLERKKSRDTTELELYFELCDVEKSLTVSGCFSKESVERVEAGMSETRESNFKHLFKLDVRPQHDPKWNREVFYGKIYELDEHMTAKDLAQKAGNDIRPAIIEAAKLLDNLK